MAKKKKRPARRQPAYIATSHFEKKFHDGIFAFLNEEDPMVKAATDAVCDFTRYMMGYPPMAKKKPNPVPVKISAEPVYRAIHELIKDLDDPQALEVITEIRDNCNGQIEGLLDEREYAE